METCRYTNTDTDTEPMAVVTWLKHRKRIRYFAPTGSCSEWDSPPAGEAMDGAGLVR